MKRKSEGKIYPWNFVDKVDLDQSEEAFINRMTNNCSYLPGETVLPQNSLLYCSLSNKVLVLSEENGAKGDKYPISAKIRQKMGEMWRVYYEKGLISDEKYRRLTRANAFSNTEKMEFINRQLVETRQSTKALHIREHYTS